MAHKNLHPLAVWRKTSGITQATLAKKIGVSQQAVDRYESGDRFPRPRVMMAINKITGIDASAFYGPFTNNSDQA